MRDLWRVLKAYSNISALLVNMLAVFVVSSQ